MVVGTRYKKVENPECGNLWGGWGKDENTTLEDAAFGFIVMENGAVINLESAWALNTLEVREAITSVCGTLAGDGMLAGKFAFGVQSTWAIGIRRARLTSCVDTTGVTNADYLQLLRAIDVTVEELSTKPKYELGPAGDLTAADAAKIVVSVKADGVEVPGWSATVEDGELKLVNPNPVLGTTIFFR